MLTSLRSNLLATGSLLLTRLNLSRPECSAAQTFLEQRSARQPSHDLESRNLDNGIDAARLYLEAPRSDGGGGDNHRQIRVTYQQLTPRRPVSWYPKYVMPQAVKLPIVTPALAIA